MQHNTFPHQTTEPSARLEQTWLQPPIAEAQSAMSSFERRTAHMGATALDAMSYAQRRNTATIRATALPVEGTLATPTVPPAELGTLSANEIAGRLVAVNTPANARNVALELYGRPAQTEKEQTRATMLASIMERNQPPTTFRQRAQNLLRQR